MTRTWTTMILAIALTIPACKDEGIGDDDTTGIPADDDSATDDDDDVSDDDDASDDDTWPAYADNPFVFALEQDVPGWTGGFFVHDLDADGLMDFVVAGETAVGAYDHWGGRMWVLGTGVYGAGEFPGLHHPAAIAGDMDGDGAQEVAWLTGGQELLVVDGVTGAEERRHPFPGAQAVVIADLQGEGDREAILQYSQTELKAIRIDSGAVVWETDEYISGEHSPARQADLDGDGLDEVAGVTFIDHDGSLMSQWDLADLGSNRWNVDSVAIADVVPGGALEAALAEQGSNNEAIVVNHEQVVYHASNPDNPCCDVAGECQERDCDKVAIGDYSLDQPGLEVFCRSACGRAPWVHDATGAIIAAWTVDDTKPESWYIDGLEMVAPIDWDGDDRAEILAKERHVAEDAAIIDPMTGEFREVFTAEAERAYAADIAGDRREEVVVLDLSGTILVFWNEAPSLGASGARKWEQQHYRRQKQNWNYYSP